MTEERNDLKPRPWCDWLTASFLFLATAAVVVWQNSRLGILWDLSYILENSYRISLGDIPYRDFPFPYAPLTFITQAAIIKLTGRVFWHHIVYCAVIGGGGTVVTWRILLQQFRPVAGSARLLALILSTPLIVLGLYCVYPHPFYDPDCTFVMLVCILLLQRLERTGFPWLPTVLAGVLLVAPLFVKQNTGLAFLGSVGLAVVVLALLEVGRRRSKSHADLPESAPHKGRPWAGIRGYVWLICGALIGLTVALLLIHFTAGLENYRHWTVTFAASRRAPSFRDMFSVYEDRLLPWWLAAAVSGALVFKLGRGGKRLFTCLALLLMAVPFAWPVIYLFIDNDASERAERLLSVWPFVLIVAFLFCGADVLRNRGRGQGIELALPFVLIGVIHGAFLSQQLWGSTYALWSLLMLLVASIMTRLFRQSGEQSRWPAVSLASAIAVTLFIAGGFYVRSHERLDYANLTDGDMRRSILPPLRGLSVRGEWLADFEELVSYSEKEIPREDGILMIPGEDLFYYTTGRRPRFPVLMFDHTVNPYSVEDIFEQARSSNIRWLVIKEETQLDEDPLLDLNRNNLLNRLRQDFKHVESLNNYEIYRRKIPGDSEDEQEDKDEPDDDPGDGDDSPDQ
jgi:hypothetical protein